jgi:hypothetical protein
VVVRGRRARTVIVTGQSGSQLQHDVVTSRLPEPRNLPEFRDPY